MKYSPDIVQEQLIITNFRFWSGENLFGLNNLNYLFGPISPGKSSVIQTSGIGLGLPHD